MFLSSYILRSFRLLRVKTEGQTIYTENVNEKLLNWNQISPSV